MLNQHRRRHHGRGSLARRSADCRLYFLSRPYEERPRRRHRSSVCNRPSAASQIGGGAAGRYEMSALGTGTIECRLVSSHHDQRHRVARGRIRFGRALRHHPDQSRRQQRENRRYRWGTGFGASPTGSPCALHAPHRAPTRVKPLLSAPSPAGTRPFCWRRSASSRLWPDCVQCAPRAGEPLTSRDH
jgi:hypothetical protein